MSNALETNYLINVHLKQAEGVTTLLNQLTQLQRLAREGADYNVRIDATALNGVTNSIANAVKKGVEKGVDMARPSMPQAAPATTGGSRPDRGEIPGLVTRRPGDAGSLDHLRYEMAKLSTAMGHLTGALRSRSGGGFGGASGGGGSTHRYEQQSYFDPQATARIKALEMEVKAAREAKNAAETRLAFANKALNQPQTTQNFHQIYNRGTDALRALNLSSAHKSELDKIKAEFEGAVGLQNPRSRQTAEQAALARLRNLLMPIFQKLQERQSAEEEGVREMDARLHKLESDLANVTRTGHRERTVRVSTSGGGGGGTGSGFTGVALDMSAVEASFISMADKVGERILGILKGAPEGAVSAGLGAARSAIRSTPKHYDEWEPKGLEEGAHAGVYDAAKANVLYVPGGFEQLGAKAKQQEAFIRVLQDRERRLSEQLAKISIDENGSISGVSNHEVRGINAISDSAARRQAALGYQRRAEAQYLGARQGMAEFNEYVNPASISDPARRQARQAELENAPLGVRLPMEYGHELFAKLKHATAIARDAYRRGKEAKSNTGIFQGDELEHWNELSADPILSKLLSGGIETGNLNTILNRLAKVRQPLAHFYGKAETYAPRVETAPTFHPGAAQNSEYLGGLADDYYKRGWRFAHMSEGRERAVTEKIHGYYKAMEEQVLPDGTVIRTNEKERERIREKLEPLIKEREMQGRWYVEAHEQVKPSFYMRDGLHVTAEEARALDQQKVSRLQAFDPVVEAARQKGVNPVWGSSGGTNSPWFVDKTGARDPISGAATNINALVAGLKKMEELNFSNLSNAFKELATSISQTMGQLKPLEGMLGNMTQEEVKLKYLQLTNEERERHQSEVMKMRGAGNQKVREERARLMAQRDLMSRWAAGVSGRMGDTEYDNPGALAKDMSKRVRRMAGYQNSMSDTQYLISELNRIGSPTDAEWQRYGTTAAKYGSQSVYLGRQAAALAKMDPQKYAHFAKPAAAFNEAADIVYRLEALQRATEDAREVLQRTQPNEYELGKFGTNEANAHLQEQKRKARYRNSMSVMAAFDLVPMTPELESQRAQLGNAMNIINGSFEDKATKPWNEMSKEEQQAYTAKRNRLGKARDLVSNLLPLLQQQGVPVAATPEGGVALSIEKLGQRAEQAETHLAKTRETMLKTVGPEMLAYTDRTTGAWDKFSKKLRELAYYLAAGGLLYTVINTLRDGVRQVIALESDMASIQGVFVNKTPSERALVKAGVLSAATDYGVPLSQVASSAKIFAQTGASPKRTMELTRASLEGTVGAGLERDQATEMLIAVENITKGRVSPEDIIDRISRIEARNAVTSQDLSTAIQRVGSVAVQMQPTALGTVDALDSVIAMSTSIIEKTRVTGNQAATSLRFMLSRLAAPDVAKSLQKQFGINLAEEKSTQMRPLTDILGDIASKYQGYLKSGDTVKANSLLSTFAGARQVNSAAALFSDWEGTMKIAEESSMAFGDSQRRLAIQMDTLAMRVNKTQNAFYAFMDTLINRTPIGSLLKGGTTLLGNALNAAAGSTGGAMIGGGAIAGLIGGAGAIGGGAMGMAGMITLGTLLGQIGLAVAAVGAAVWAIQKLAEPDQKRQANLDHYGPSTITASDLKELEFVKRYRQSALGYGMSTEGLQSTLGTAAARTRESMIARFGDKNLFNDDGSLRTTNPKLARAYEREFTEQLKKTLPGFEEVGDEAAQTAEALRLFKETLRYSTAMGAVEQSHLAEQGTQITASIKEAFMDAGQRSLPGGMIRAVKDKQAGRDMLHDEGGRMAPFTVMTLDNIGLAWQSAMSTYETARGDKGNPREDAFTIMKQLMGGMARPLAGLNVRGAGGKNYQVLDRLVASANGDTTLGRAMDQVARDAFTLSAQMQALWEKTYATTTGTDRFNKTMALLEREQGKNAELAKETVRVQGNRQNLAAALYQPMYDQLEIEARKSKIGTQTLALQDSNTVVGGALMGQALIDAYQTNIEKFQTQLRAKGFAGFAASLDVDKAVLANPKNRQQMAAQIQGTLSGSGSRMYTRDRYLESLIRFAEGESSITSTAGLLGRSGVGYDALGERIANSQQLVRALAGAQPMMQSDLARAYHKYNSTNPNRIRDDLNTLQVADFEGEDGRPARLSVAGIAGFAASLEENTKARQQLELNTGIIEAALKNIASTDLLDTLPPKLKEWILTALGSQGNEKLVRMGLLAGVATELATKQLNDRVEEDRRRQNVYVDAAYGANRSALEAHWGFAAAGSDIQHQIRMAGILQNPLAAYTSQGAAITLTQQQSQAEAARTRTLALIAAQRDLALGGAGAQGKYDDAVTQLERAYKDAMDDANRTALQSMADLVTQAAETFAEKIETQVSGLREATVGTFAGLFKNYRNLDTHPGQQLLSGIGGAVQDRLATAFSDNLFGKNGIFGSALDKLFSQQMFMDSSTIFAKQVMLVAGGVVGGESQKTFASLTGGDPRIAALLNDPNTQRIMSITGMPKSTQEMATWRKLLSPNAVATYGQYTDSMNVNSALFDLPKDAQYETVWHELGHRLATQNPNLMKAFVKAANGRKGTDDYYNTNADEGFAETFYGANDLLYRTSDKGMSAEAFGKALTSGEAATPGFSSMLNYLLSQPAYANHPLRQFAGDNTLAKLGSTVGMGGLGLAGMTGVGADISAMDAVGVAVNSMPTQDDISKQLAGINFLMGGGKGMTRLKALGSQAAVMAGTLGGAALGNKMGVHGPQGNYAQEGASVGAMLGSVIPGIGTVVGSVLGSVVGGIFGGRIGKGKREDPVYAALEKIERNTAQAVTALDSQLKMLDIDNRVLNLPNGFNVPRLMPFGGSGGSNLPGQDATQAPQINITIQDARDPDAVAQAVATRLRQELRSIGSYSTSRY